MVHAKEGKGERERESAKKVRKVAGVHHVAAAIHVTQGSNV